MLTVQQLEGLITQLFNPSIGEYGQDYAVNVGTPIYSPVSGVVGTEDLGKQAWGKRVFVHVSSAIGGVATFAVGHLTSFAVSAGQHVNAGDLLGYSGGAKSDPSSGDSTGPHVETQFLSAAGNPINPKSVFAQFGSWESAIFNGLGSAAGIATGNTIANLDPLASIPNAITSGVNRAAQLLVGFGLGFGFVVVGLFLIFFGDIEKGVEQVVDVAEKAAPAAAVAA